jgi:hypothetical protein
VAGYEGRVAIERKSKADAYGSIGGGRERFEREFQRLSELEYGAVVIESSIANFLVPPRHSQMNPRSALLSFLAWSVKYGVPVFFADDRRHGQALTKKLLDYCMIYKVARIEVEGAGGESGGGPAVETRRREADGKRVGGVMSGS